jgi:hypothetical protein
MLKIKEIYTLPFTPPRALTDWVLGDDWFPEIGGCGRILTSPTLTALQAEGRLTVREVVNDYIDGYRVRMMMTLWLDGEPVCIIQAAGRDGRDHLVRWVTDAPRYWQLLAYLLSKVEIEDDSQGRFVDPDTEVYEETVFSFYGKNDAERFGYATEEKVPGYCILPHADSIVRGVRLDQALVMLSKLVPEPAQYIRSGDYVMELERPLSRAELDSNPRLEASLEGTSNDRYVWYKAAKRPKDQPVLSV